MPKISVDAENLLIDIQSGGQYFSYCVLCKGIGPSKAEIAHDPTCAAKPQSEFPYKAYLSLPAGPLTEVKVIGKTSSGDLRVQCKDSAPWVMDPVYVHRKFEDAKSALIKRLNSRVEGTEQQLSTLTTLLTRVENAERGDVIAKS